MTHENNEKCDLCSKNTPHLEQLNDQYQTETIKQICSGCSRMVNNHLWEVRKLTNGIIKNAVTRFMVERKMKMAPPETLCTKAP